MKRARFSSKAEHDLEAIFRFIAGDNPDAAEHVRQNVLNVADFLAEHPEVGRADLQCISAPRWHSVARGS